MKLNSLLNTYKKVDGKNILRQYTQAGVLLFALTDMARLGFSRTALEIVRLSAQYKIVKKLRRKYAYVFNEIPEDEHEHIHSDFVWICWLQGLEQAPPLVQRCCKSICDNLKSKKIIIITAENYKDYITMPDYIVEKWENGLITNTHITDFIRLELLLEYGGTWIDATVFCTGNHMPQYIWNADLFLYQALKPGRDGHYVNVSSWFISASSHNIVLKATLRCLYEYWRKNDRQVDYYLIHDFLCIAAEAYPDEWKKIPKICNSIPHLLLNELFEPYDQERFEHIKQLSCFHKLTYKRDKGLFKKKGTYYDVIFD